MIIGVDVGTSATKAVGYDRAGAVVAAAERPSRLARYPDGRVEQDLDDVLGSAAAVIAEVAAHASAADPVHAVALTGQGDGLWLRDHDGAATRPPISWLDDRAGDLLRRWQVDGTAATLHQRTGAGLFPGSPAALLAHLASEEPEVLERAAVAGYCVDAIVQRLTGEITVDASDASMPFLNVSTRRYDQPALRACGLAQHRGLLAEPAAPGRLFHLDRRGAELTGLPEGLPVTGGPFDLPAAALGAGLTEPGDGLLIIGTTLACQVITDTLDRGSGAGVAQPDRTEALAAERGPGRAATGGSATGGSATGGSASGDSAGGDSATGVFDVAGMWLCLPQPDRWMHAMPAMVGTASLDWVLDLIGHDIADLAALLDASTPGAGGVSALPFLAASGERAPFVDTRAWGQLTGVSLGTRRGDVVRAVCEAVAYAARHCFEALAPTGTIIAAGGGARSGPWAQLFADVLGRPLLVPDDPGLGTRGAAITAREALGDPVDPRQWAAPLREVRPTPRVRAHYDQGYRRYRELLAGARSQWTRLNPSPTENRPPAPAPTSAAGDGPRSPTSSAPRSHP